ncbi:hypothetical protein K501DRAFT_274192 [Backusella circina FSU 941]|nr:hypothetical protein K501DRAFT_274192 [Backusella circina FSU 941]
MGNREREEVKRRNLAEDIPSERVEEYVDKELNNDGELNALLVKVFDDSSDDIYRITVIDKEMINCECYYFNIYQKPYTICQELCSIIQSLDRMIAHNLYLQGTGRGQEFIKEEGQEIYKVYSYCMEVFMPLFLLFLLLQKLLNLIMISLQKQQNSTVLNDIKNLLNHFYLVESQEAFDEED